MALPGSSAPSRSAPASSTERAPTPPNDWPIQATDTIVRAVDRVRDKTTGPVLNAVRWLVYGLVLALLSLPVFVFLLVGSMRAVEHLLIDPPFTDWGLTDPMWLVYLLFGSLFAGGGLLLWSKAKQVREPFS